MNKIPETGRIREWVRTWPSSAPSGTVTPSRRSCGSSWTMAVDLSAMSSLGSKTNTQSVATSPSSSRLNLNGTFGGPFGRPPTLVFPGSGGGGGGAMTPSAVMSANRTPCTSGTGDAGLVAMRALTASSSASMPSAMRNRVRSKSTCAPNGVSEEREGERRTIAT